MYIWHCFREENHSIVLFLNRYPFFYAASASNQEQFLNLENNLVSHFFSIRYNEIYSILNRFLRSTLYHVLFHNV